MTFSTNILPATNAQVDFIFVAAVPEPSTFALLVVGGAGILGYAWRRRRIAA